MWYLWPALLLVSCAAAEQGAAEPAPATPRPPPPRRTLDRQAAELAWRSWLQSPESGNQNAPPRRITTKSLFITPLVCPKGQRLDRNGCVQIVTVNKDEHERILLEQLNALFTSAPSGDVVYDYGEDEPGPLQLSIPIGLDPQASPLQAQEPSAQAQEVQPTYHIDKKDDIKPESDLGIEAELELLKLQLSQNIPNDTASSENADILNHNVLNNLILDKPKRDSPVVNSTEIESTTVIDKGQKEVIYGHVNVDPVLYDTENIVINTETETDQPSELVVEPVPTPKNLTVINNATDENNNKTIIIPSGNDNKTVAIISTNSTTHVLKDDGDKTKLNPENDYSDMGEAIKLISRYAEVTTDDNFTKDHKKHAMTDDSILGTRTKLQHRRNKPKVDIEERPTLTYASPESISQEKTPMFNVYPKQDTYYRYPWQGQHSPTPPPDYPFRHLQDYWRGQSRVGGVYNAAHENPRRHHHNYPHNYFKPRGLPYFNYPGLPEAYAAQLQDSHRAALHHASPLRSHSNNQDLYSLLGLRHWFSSEGTSKR